MRRQVARDFAAKKRRIADDDIGFRPLTLGVKFQCIVFFVLSGLRLLKRFRLCG